MTVAAVIERGGKFLFVEERIDGRDHQMDIEWLRGVRPKRLHHGGTDGEVGHEMAVHDVDVDPIGSGLLDLRHLFSEPGEIRREDRRGELHAFPSKVSTNSR